MLKIACVLLALAVAGPAFAGSCCGAKKAVDAAKEVKLGSGDCGTTGSASKKK